MRLVNRLLSSVGLGQRPQRQEEMPNYALLMRDSLTRIRLAEIKIREAASLEELDIGRCSLLAAHAELVQLIRTAKRDRGYSVRPVSECEEMHRRMVDLMSSREEGRDKGRSYA